MEERIKQLEKEVAELKKQVKVHAEWINLAQLWIEKQIELNKMIKV